MSGLQVKDVPMLLDPATGLISGYLDGNGREQDFNAAAMQALVTEYGNGYTAYGTPSDLVRLTAAAGLKCGAGRLAAVRCESGSAVTLTVYDRADAAAGRVIYTAAMSAGDFAKPDAWALNGMTAAFSSGTFEFELAEA